MSQRGNYHPALDTIAVLCGTDKSSKGHCYAAIYESYFEPFRFDHLAVIEIGAGGYEYPDRGGESLRMWHQYFPKAKICCVDLHNKTGLINDRTSFWQGSQTDKNLIEHIIDLNAECSKRIFINDASHINDLTIKTFEIAWPQLSSGDFYVIEDCHTSYWSKNYGGNEKPGTQGTIVSQICNIVPQLCHDTLEPKHRVTGFAGYLDFIHFYRNLIIIKKK